jgi:hypothetical protein
VERDHEMSCVHRWILSEPSRGSVRGTCRRCGAHRSYAAGIELPPPPEDEDDEVVLDLPALAAAIKSMKREILV